MKRIITTLLLIFISSAIVFADEKLPLERPPVSDIIAYVLIGIGAAAIIASIIILKKKKNDMLKKK